MQRDGGLKVGETAGQNGCLLQHLNCCCVCGR